MGDGTMAKGFTGNSIIVITNTSVITTMGEALSFTWDGVFSGHPVIIHYFLFWKITV
jgi:hypothetical protein